MEATLRFLQLAAESSLVVGAAVSSVSWVAGGIQSSYVRKPLLPRHPAQKLTVLDLVIQVCLPVILETEGGGSKYKIILSNLARLYSKTES